MEAADARLVPLDLDLLFQFEEGELPNEQFSLGIQVNLRKTNPYQTFSGVSAPQHVHIVDESCFLNYAIQQLPVNRVNVYSAVLFGVKNDCVERTGRYMGQMNWSPRGMFDNPHDLD